MFSNYQQNTNKQTNCLLLNKTFEKKTVEFKISKNNNNLNYIFRFRVNFSYRKILREKNVAG